MRMFVLLLAALAVLLTPVDILAKPTPANAFDYEFEAIEGGKLALDQWRGKVLLVVNTASFCGYTPQYAGLQKLWETYEGRGLIVLGVPSNDFGGQEPNKESEILGFCQGAYNVTFPLTTKEVVSGDKAHPFYRWAVEKLGASAAPRWNFHKYLVGRDGQLVADFDTQVEPQSPQLIGAVEKALLAN